MISIYVEKCIGAWVSVLCKKPNRNGTTYAFLCSCFVSKCVQMTKKIREITEPNTRTPRCLCTSLTVHQRNHTKNDEQINEMKWIKLQQKLMPFLKMLLSCRRASSNAIYKKICIFIQWNVALCLHLKIYNGNSTALWRQSFCNDRLPLTQQCIVHIKYWLLH